ncbi:MAG: acetylornithine/N-succinyldiaminopimelate aminotransferase [Verrucomicrobiales bacterium]|jgi:acetylornithine/N-succinyldiaminopimelate aminotransferase
MPTKFQTNVAPTYGRFPITPIRGEGARLWDADGTEYLDFGGGVAVNSLGHCHPRMVAAIHSQSQQLIHCSNLYEIPGQADLAELIADTVMESPGKTFFSNSGAEANEVFYKLARRHKPGQRHEIITFTGSFHGRTMGGISATAQAKMHDGFEPLLPGFNYVEFNDVAALRAAITDKTAAILIEPIQGEGGINIATAEFLNTAADLCKQRDLLLFFDEVQCGLGRCGKLKGWQSIEGAEHIIPDAVSWAKGIGGGFPLGAVWINARDGLCDLLGPGMHGSTYGGSPLACAVGLAVLNEIEEAQLCENSARLGREIVEEVTNWNSPKIAAVRGRGLMIGFELDPESFEWQTSTPAMHIINQLTAKGLLTVPAGPKVVRFLPPLTISDADKNEALSILKSVIQ